MAGFWSIIVPEANTNLVTNPSIFNDTTGYTAVGGSIVRDTTFQRREIACLKISPTAGVNDGAYYGTVSLTTGQSYTFSLDVWGIDNLPLKIYFADTSGTEKGTATTFTGTSYWIRQEVTWTCDSTASYRLYITKNNHASTFPVLIDGVQCENKAYSTTYVDGNQEGCKWTGAEHASTSERDAQSRAGGRVYNLDNYGFYIDDMPGIGMPPVLHQTQEQPMLPGSLLRGIKTKPRVFDLIANQIGDTHEDLHSKRKDLLNTIKPDLVLESQHFILRYTGANSGKPVEIRAVYDSGFQFTKLDGFTERDLPLRFIAYEEPYFQEIGDVSVILSTTNDVSDADYIISKVDGVWDAMGTGMNNEVRSIVKGQDDGYIYVGGAFVSAGGVSNTNRIARWGSGSWSAMGTGSDDSFVYDLVVGADGSVYAGGAFTGMGGVANTAYVAHWDGSSWNALGTGMDDTVWALAIGLDGTLYAAGDFTDAGGTAATRIASWDGSSWSALGTGCNGQVNSLAIAKNGNLYAGGNFTTAGGTTVNYVAEWDGSSWSALGSGIGSTVFVVEVSNNGLLYIGGNFTTAGGISASKIACWNGRTYTALQDGVNSNVYSIKAKENIIYVGGSFTEAGGLSVADRFAVWNGSTWSHADVNFPGSATVYDVLLDGQDLYIGYDTSGTATTSYLGTVANDGTHKAYPKIAVKRSGGTTARLEWIKNETTGATIYLDCSLLDGEEIEINFAEGNRSITSSLFGEGWRPILRSSEFTDFFLLPGNNDISVFVNETGSPTITAYMQWRNTHWSADGVAA